MEPPAEGSEPPAGEYFFHGIPTDLLVALGRLVIRASFLEASASMMLARLISDNDDRHLALGYRLTANATFPWLLDHIRAVSEIKMPEPDHADVVAWLKRAETAYSRRSRIIHADWGFDVTGDEPMLIFMRRTARRKTFLSEEWLARSGEIHAIALDLEHAGLDAARLMPRIPRS